MGPRPLRGPLSRSHPSVERATVKPLRGPGGRPERWKAGDTPLSEIVVGDSEPFESALKRFNKRVQQDGILSETRRREHYEKPSVKRKKKEAARLRKLRKKKARSEARAASRR